MAKKTPFEMINVKMGTENSRRFSQGNILPLLCFPHGLASFTVQTTSNEESWFYNPRHRSFEGIRLTHQPSPWINDYGQLLILPQTGAETKTDADGRWSGYIEQEFNPSYMRGYLTRYRLDYEVAPASSGGFMRFTFRENADKNRRILLLGLNGETAFERQGDAIIGYTTAVNHGVDFELTEYFYIEVDCKFTLKQLEQGASIELDSSVDIVNFNMATSFISYHQASLAYEREIKVKNLEQAQADCKHMWTKELSRIEVKAKGEDQQRREEIFYTCMYRAFIFPRRFHEFTIDGRAVHINLKNGQLEEGALYVDNGFWDTFRTVYPLYSILCPELYDQIAEGYYNVYRDTNWLPRWLGPNEIACMPGTLIEAVLSDAIVKDVVNKELGSKMLSAMTDCAERDEPDPRYGRKEAGLYRKLGYLPYDKVHESVNETLDCAYGDYCISAAARKLGKNDIADRYLKYSKNYRNVFDPSVGFMRAKDSNGEFRLDFDSCNWGRDYTEASAWQSSFAVYHDFSGLNELYLGKLEDKLDELFAAPPHYTVCGYGFEIHEMTEMALADFGQCAISNQPSFHLPFIYCELGKPDKASKEVKNLVDNGFTIDRFPGDEDNGTTACWYIFACMGIYPVCPSKPEYALCNSLFDEIKIKLPHNKTFTIKPGKRSAGKITHKEIMDGGEI